VSKLAAVSFIRDTPALTDMAGWLRHLAMEVEQGRLEPTSMAVVFELKDASLDARYFGGTGSHAHYAGLLFGAAVKFTRDSWDPRAA
jgi:type IV secretory pathway protease TraF